MDGSTTRACEALVAQPVTLDVHHQQRTAHVPNDVHRLLGGGRWLERVTSLVANGQVLMDNLTYTRLDAVPEWFVGALDQGLVPIGHLLQRLYLRREMLEVGATTQQVLWQHVGQPDLPMSRSYRIVTPDGPLMLLFEVFRGGLVPRDGTTA